MEFLASDKLEGRNTGSEGHRRAAEFVAAQFERDGLKPAGAEGYMQRVKFNTLQLDESDSSLALERDGKEQAVELGEDAIIGTRVDPAPAVEAGMYFVGYGLRVPDDNYDDFAGLDTKGKIAVYIGGAPSTMSSALAARTINQGGSAGRRAEERRDDRRDRRSQSASYGCPVATNRVEPVSDDHAARSARDG